MKRYPYFKTGRVCLDGTPAPGPLRCAVQRTVRFEEVDPMGVVWHGRYPSYFEDARVAFGERYGIAYSLLIERRMPAPIKQMHVDYLWPLRFGQSCTITAELHWSEAARMNYSYTVHDDSGLLVTTGYTVQLFVSAGGDVLLEQPDFYAELCARWKAGDFGDRQGETP